MPKSDKKSKKSKHHENPQNTENPLNLPILTDKKPLVQLTFEHISIYSATCIYKFFDGPMDTEFKKMITDKDNVELKEAYAFYLKHKKDLKTFFDIGEHLLEKIPPTTLWKNWITIGPPEPLIEFQVTEEMQRHARVERNIKFQLIFIFQFIFQFQNPDKNLSFLLEPWPRKNQTPQKLNPPSLLKSTLPKSKSSSKSSKLSPTIQFYYSPPTV